MTQANLAVELRVRRQTVWCFLKRHPDAWSFVDDQMQRSTERYFGLVQRRHAILGMQGSVPSAEVYFKSHAGHYARAAGAEGFQVAPGAFQLNILVPRPDMPGLPPPSPGGVVAGPAPTRPPAGLIQRPATPARQDIPTVAIR